MLSGRWRWGWTDDSPRTKQRPKRGRRASRYIQDFAKLAAKRPGLCVVIYARVSGREQGRNGNARNQVRFLKRKLRKLGITIVGVYIETASGWDHGRPRFRRAIRRARKARAVLVALSADRVLRSKAYSKFHQGTLPTVKELEALKKITRGVTVATWLDPDMGWRDVRAFVTKLGQQTKKHKGGRPPKEQLPTPQSGDTKFRRINGKSRVFWGMVMFGWSASKTAKEFGLNDRNVRRWRDQLLTAYQGGGTFSEFCGRFDD